MRRVQTSDVIDFEVIGVARIVAGPKKKVDVGGNVTRDDGGVSADQEDTLVLKFNIKCFSTCRFIYAVVDIPWSCAVELLKQQ